jgi:predicted alpha/beta-fold hydrolase
MASKAPGKMRFQPRWGLGGGHRQTLAGAFLPPRNLLPAPERRLFRVDLDVQVLAWCNWQERRQAALTALIVHGLEGSSDSPYVVGTASKAWQAGMNVVRMNVRNCGGSERLGGTLYHSGLSADVGAVARALIAEEKLPRLALAGFSMGGNQVLKLAGEWGSDAPAELCAVAAVCPGVDLAACAREIHRWSNRIYEWNFVWSLKRTLRLKAACYPGRFDLARLRRVHTLRDFDDTFTAPHWGFAGADDYYARASASPVLERIAVPTLVLHALDDPFVRITPATRARLLANPKVQLVETERGGHCGFLAAADGYDGRWAEREIVNFFTSAT